MFKKLGRKSLKKPRGNMWQEVDHQEKFRAKITIVCERM
jgi:hypothetical protein